MMAFFQRAAALRRLRRCNRVGPGVRTDGVPDVTNQGRVEIGARFSLSCVPVKSHLTAGPGARLRIGDDVSVAHGAAIAAFEEVSIGDGSRLGPFAIVMDTTFHAAPGDMSASHRTRPVAIGRGCVIGSAVTILRGSQIGDGAQVLAGSVVSGPVPAGCRAAGVPARPLGPAAGRSFRWSAAAAQLPELAAAALSLDAVPWLDTLPSPWDERAFAVLSSAIEERFRVRLPHSAIRAARSLWELAAAIDAAESARFTAPVSAGDRRR